MSTQRNKERVFRRTAQKHNFVLNNLLDGFFKLLDRKPQPSRDEIRSEFINREKAWQSYCQKHGLGTRPAMLFNAKVAVKWEREYVKKSK